MNYLIDDKQLACINILIRSLQEAIHRECFDNEETNKIYKTVELLTQKSNRKS